MSEYKCDLSKVGQKIVEMNGMKLEIDFTGAQKIENFKVGDTVKVLKKKYDSSPYEMHSGVIIGFYDFESLPSILIAYIENDYNIDLKFECFNAENKNIQICKANEHEILFDKSDVIAKLDREIIKVETQLEDIKRKKKFFLENFNKFFPN